jgi:hypothetical protein
MKIYKSEVLEAVRHILSPEQLKDSLIFWDKKIHEEGETIMAGLQTILMPFRGTMVFVDLAPKYNWAHPCLYIFIDCKVEKTHMIEASFPPTIDEADEDYEMLLRYGETPSA